MARGVNKAIIVGTLGKDPEVKYTASGSAVASLSVATNESWKDKNTGQTVERTEWHRIVMFGKLAEIAGQYLKKGAHAYFEGKIQTRKWQDQSGQDRYSTEIVIDQRGVMQMMGGGGDSNGHASSSRSYQQSSAPSQSAAGGQEQQTPAFHRDKAPAQDDGFDDIPF